jgi:hypothetical protein
MTICLAHFVMKVTQLRKSCKDQDFSRLVTFIIKRIGRALLRVGNADEAIHCNQCFVCFWIASCCVPRSRNDDEFMTMITVTA